MLNDTTLRTRPRRLRRNALVRNLSAPSVLSLDNLIQPYFVVGQENQQEPIKGFTDVYRLGKNPLIKQIEKDREAGVKSFLLFGSSDAKDATGSPAVDDAGVLPNVLREIKRQFGNDVLLFTDVCLCPFTDHGHCGFLSSEGEILNDQSLSQLAKMALVHAQAGADFVAPSDMMDGRVAAIRDLLDKNGFDQTGILAYTAKYASNYYGPFREALDSSPKQGDRSSYQMDFRRADEALHELKLDVEEGADLVMVKPALAYLDIISKFSQNSPVPVAAYSVSGEYEMVKQMARLGQADEKRLATENLTAIRRAGAQIIISYFTSPAATGRWFT